MTSSDKESKSYPKPSEEKKKKMKQKNSEGSIVKESEHQNNENTTKKKPKKKTNATEEDSEIMDVIPKKKTTLDISSGDPTSTEATQKKKKKKKKNVLGVESSMCDPQTNDGVPKKKKKKNEAEDATSCEQDNVDAVHEEREKHSALVDSKKSVTKKKKKKEDDTVNAQTANENVPKRKGITEDRSITSEDPEGDTVTKQKKKGTKKVLPSSEDKDVTTDQTSNKKVCFNSKVKKCKKSKPAEKLEKEVGSPEVSDHAKVKKKKKKKVTFEKSEGDVIEDHEVHHGKEVEDSLRVSKKKKMSKDFTFDEDSGQRNPDLNGNRGKDSDHTSEGSSKQKKGSKSKEVTGFMDSKKKSLHVACEEVKNKAKKKRKREEKLRHTDEEQSANEDTTEVPKKKQKIKDKAKNSKEATKEQEERTGIQLGLAQDGSRDEVYIDKARRKALQEDIDRESGKTKGTKFGQWDTATFQNAEQQSKFFRLLGGLKKGNQATVTSHSNKVKANMALGKQEEQALERNLLGEFEKAVSWRQNRGIGIGFQPAQNKTFFIDKTASRSVKFED